MKIELSDKEIKAIGRERYRPKYNKIWNIFGLVICTLIFIYARMVKILDNNLFSGVSAMVLIFCILGAVIIISIKTTCKINKAGKDFLAQCKRDDQNK